MNIKFLLLLVFLAGSNGIQAMEKEVSEIANYKQPLDQNSGNQIVPDEIIENIIYKADSIEEALDLFVKFSIVNKNLQVLFNDPKFLNAFAEHLKNKFGGSGADMQIFLSKQVFDAAKKHNSYQVLLLIKLGSNVNLRNIIDVPKHLADMQLFLSKQLFAAAKKHNSDQVLLLIKLGANVNLRNIIEVPEDLVEDRRSLGHDVKKLGDSYYYFGNTTPLIEAIEAIQHIEPTDNTINYRKTIELLLEQTKDKTIIDNALGRALGISKVDPKVVDLLIKCGANVNKRGAKTTNPLIKAARRSSPEVVKLLIDAGANLNVQDDRKRTALIWAAEEGNYKVAKLLLDLGADIYIKDDTDFTALDWATRNNRKDIIDLINSRSVLTNIYSYIQNFWPNK